MNSGFRYYSMRARKARFGRFFKSAAIRFLLWLIFFGLILGGLAWVYFGKNSAGWILVGFAFPFMMLAVWAKNDLINVPSGKGDTITDLMSSNCLAVIKNHPAPSSIVDIIPKTRSGRFLLSRLEVPLDLFYQIVSNNNIETEKIFEKAMEIRIKTNSAHISGAIFAIAIIENCPDYGKILHQLKLDLDDFYQVTTWFNYIHGVVKDAKKPHHTGGIGRDLSFGYIPILQKFGTNISMQRQNQPHTQIPQGNRTEVLEKMIEIFTKNGRQNAALIGPNGSGRTTIVYAFAEILLDANKDIPSSLKFRQVFSLDASSLISSASKPGEIESLMNQIFNEAYTAKNIILCLDNAHLFFEEGVGSVDISNVLAPILDAGNLKLILIMDEQHFLEISAKNSTLANSLNKIMVPPADRETTLKVLQDQIPLMEYQLNTFYTYKSLLEAYQLSDRYIHDIEMPGKAKLLLSSAANFAENGIVTTKSVQEAIEKTQGVKMQSTQTAEDKSKLLNLEDEIHQRMVDQMQAVNAVSNALRRSAAGVRNQNRPIGTFLFMGPTGVGKTELAKAISEVYFRGEKEIIRIDLNEFVEPSDVARLIADSAENATSLTAQIQKKPFSVVLLDEIEKAHPQVLTTLLQVLDEGILRDSKNHEISFRDAIIIATSNAGANQIREHIDNGESLEEFKDQITNELISSNKFPPEFLNRFDEICMFKPLAKEDLVKILDLIISSTNKTLESQKISVRLDDGAKEILIEKGYDPRLGARPIRRIVQKTVENIVAKAMLKDEAGAGAEILITKEQVEAELQNI